MSSAGDILRDTRYACRVLRKFPATTSISVLALALGIGVNASCYLSINALILRPFPFRDLDRIVTVSETAQEVREEGDPLSPADFLELTRQSHSFETLAGYRDWDVSFRGAENPERVRGVQVWPTFFATLRVQPLLGRTFLESEGSAGSSAVALLSQSFWQSHLGGSKDVIGRAVELGGRRYTVVGVMPDEFDFPLGASVWVPLVLNAREQGQRAVHNVAAIGRLKAGVSMVRAAAELSEIAQRLRTAYPREEEGRGLKSTPLRDSREQVTGQFVLMLLGAASFVLLLACANVGNLQLAKVTARGKEIAVRRALGASRLELARQLMVESVMVALAAGLMGLLLADWNNALMKATIPAQALRIVPGLRTMHLDGTVMGFTMLVSVIAGMLCSLPALAQIAHSYGRVDLTEALRERSGAMSNSVQRSGFRSALIVTELALALILLVGAGLMVETFDRLLHRPQGFDANHVLLIPISLPAGAYDEPARTALYVRLLDSLATGRNVTDVALSAGASRGEKFAVEGRPEPRPGEPRPAVVAVSARYFRTLHIPIVEGRPMAESDRADSVPVAVVSRSFARYYWPKGSAVGRRFRLEPQSAWLTVAGVSEDVVDDWFSGTPSDLVYLPHGQAPPAGVTLRVRTAGDPLKAAGFVRSRIRQVDRNIAVGEVEPMQQALANQRSGVHAAAQAMTGYAMIALLLAATGVYAVISFFVAARQHDIGVRMALGASHGAVLRLILTQASRMILIGLLVGVPSAIALSHVMTSVLYGVVAMDPLVFLGFGTVLTGAALLASFLPAYRATRIDPVTALRDQ